MAAQWRLDGSAHLPAYLLFAGLSVPLATIDLSRRRLPNGLTGAAFVGTAALLAVAAAAQQHPADLVRAVAGASVGTATYLGLHLRRPTALGVGDVKLAATLGLVLAWLSWNHLLIGLTAGLLIGGAAGIVVLRRDGPSRSFAMGPAMLAGTWLAILSG
jgi:leader peptidase (prepilin peptidase)/N-methyltransferase